MPGQTCLGTELSPYQREVWEHRRWSGTRRVVAIEGAFSAETIAAAMRAFVASHDILRARFQCAPELPAPVWHAEPDATVQVERVDLSGLDPAARNAALTRLSRFDAMDDDGPLLKVDVADLGAGHQAIAIATSALVADPVTVDLLIEWTLSRLTSSRPEDAGGAEGDAPAVRFGDLARWQNELLTAEEEAPGRAYWQARRDERAGTHPLNVAAPAPGATCEWSLAPIEPVRGVVHELAAWAAARGITLDIVMEALWRVFLARVTGEATVPVGILIDSRRDRELDRAVGPLSRVLPIAVPVEAAHDLLALARVVARARAEAIEWRDAYPGALVPLSAGYSYMPPPTADAAPPLRVEHLASTVALLPMPLQLLVTPTRVDVRCVLQYDAARVPAASAEVLARQFATLLASASAAPDATLRTLELVSEEERIRQLTTFQGVALPAALLLVHEAFAARAREHPARIAVVGEDGELSYDALDRRANQLARHLRNLGAGPDVPVGLVLPRGVRAIVGMLAILKAGSAYVPFEAGQPRERLRSMLEDAGVRMVLTTRALAPQLPEAPELTRIDIDADMSAIEACDSTPIETPATPGNLAYVMFTSGSTGRPKGVAVEHRHLAAYVHAVMSRLELRESRHFATVSTLAADLGHTMVFGALCSGGTLHVVAADAVTDADKLAAQLRAARVDVLKIVPSHFDAVLAADRPEWIVPARAIVFGGEALSWNLVRRVVALRPDCAVFNHYGPTETTVGVIATRLDLQDRQDRQDPHTADATERIAPLGRVLDGVRAFVLDEDGRLAPGGAIGELYVGGPTVTRGYLHRPSHTAERYVPDAISGAPGARLYRTGDRARFRPDGTLEFHGRRDNQIKFHGFRVELDEIRHAVARHPKVRDAAAMVAKDARAERLVAFYVSREEIDPDELRASVAQTLPEPIRPHAFVHLKKLPLTANGKVDVQALAALTAAPDTGRAGIIEPRTHAERVLAAIWSEVLGLDRVSVVDNFFELGGHSLNATLVIARTRAAFDVDVPFRAIFDEPTIERLARVIEQLELSVTRAADDVVGVIRQLEHLPHDEVERLLANGASPAEKTEHV